MRILLGLLFFIITILWILGLAGFVLLPQSFSDDPDLVYPIGFGSALLYAILTATFIIMFGGD